MTDIRQRTRIAILNIGPVVSANVRYWRKQRSLKMWKLSRSCWPYIRQIECGARLPSPGFLERIAERMNVPPSYLLRLDAGDRFIREVSEFKDRALILRLLKRLQTKTKEKP